MNRVSMDLLKIAGRLEEAGLEDVAAKLGLLAQEVSQNDRLLSVVEAANWIGCGRRTLDQMVSDRRIPAHLIGGRYRFDRLEVLNETKL